MRVVLREAAVRDIAAAFDWYDRRRPGLGSELLARVEACVEMLAEHSEAFQIVASDVRRALVQRFPFAIYYRLPDPETIEVIAVLHQRRDEQPPADG